MENFEAAGNAAEEAALLGTGMAGPHEQTADGLETLARHAERELGSSLERAETRTELYSHDSHYDQYTTWLWASALARAAGTGHETQEKPQG